MFRRRPQPLADSLARSLAAGASPFDLASSWEASVDLENLSPSCVSAWRQYNVMCASYSQPPLPLTVTSLMAYALWYVCVQLNSSANLGSELGHLHSYCRAQRPGIQWPDFLADNGVCLTDRLAKIRKAYPAEVQGAPALTLRAGLTRAIRRLRRFGNNLWALQWIAILSMMHSLILRPCEVIPMDKFPTAEGYPSGFAYPRMGELTFVSPDPASECAGGLQYVVALSKTQRELVDKRVCTVAAVNQLAGAEVDVARDLLIYITAAGLLGADAHTPVFYYRFRDGRLAPRLSRAAMLYELRKFILAPAGIENPFFLHVA